jgi:hypothetical protein
METKEFFKGEFLCWDDVAYLGDAERIATVITEAREKSNKFSSDKKDLVITIQLAVNMEIYDVRLNKRSWNNIRAVWGTHSSKWVGNQLKITPFVYREGKNGIELKPIKLDSITPRSVSKVDSDEILNDYIEKVKKAFYEKEVKE